MMPLVDSLPEPNIQQHPNKDTDLHPPQEPKILTHPLFPEANWPLQDTASMVPPAALKPASLHTTTDLATNDVRLVLEVQREQNQLLTTKLNILFVANGALLTTLSISRLAMTTSPFTVIEVLGFLINFTLLVQAFLPRQIAVTPNLEDRKVLERYLSLGPEDYQLQMLVNLTETYLLNKQRLDDTSVTLRYSAYATWLIGVTILLHMVTNYLFVSP
jgi:hypothetical protein